MRKTNMRRILIVSLILAMLMGIMTIGVMAAEGDATTYVAKIGDTEYETLQAAMKACVAGDNTITLLNDSAEVFTFAQKSGVNITIDGDGHTFSGKITLNAGGGNLTFTDAKIAPANSQTIYLNASTAPNVTFDGCTLQGTNKSGAIIYGYASATSNSITVKNCTADNLQYIVSHRQTGSNSVLVENVTATNMIYLVRTLKCPSVTVKNVTCDAVIGIDIKNDAAGGKLTLENVNINIVTYNGSVYAPVSGSGAGNAWTVELNGVNTFSANDVAYEDTTWFAGNAGYSTDIEAQNGSKFGSLEAIAKDAKSGETVTLLKDYTGEKITLPAGVQLNENGFENANVEEYPAVAQVGDQYFSTLSEAFAAVKNDSDTVYILADVTENLAGAYLRGNIVTKDGANVTITLTNSDWVYCPYTFVIGEGVTLNVPALCYYAGGTVIKGKVVAGAYYQMYAGTKLTIQAPGSLTVTSETCIIRSVGGDPNAGIYIIGDNNKETVELELIAAYFYQGMINAKDATIKCAVYWQTNETDNQGSANLVLDNSKLTVTGFQEGVQEGSAQAKATGNSTVTLTNGSVISCAYTNFVYSQNAKISVDSTSRITVRGVDLRFSVAQIGETGYATLQEAINAAQNGDTITFLADITENVTLTEKTGLYYTIDGNGKKMNGTITVNSLSDTNDNRRITIKNINFVDAEDANVDFISSVNTNHYPRLTIEDCTFTGSGNNGDVAIRLKSSHSVVIKDCTGKGLHSFLQNTSGWNLTVEDVTVTDSKGGLALGTVQGVTVKGCNITTDTYGVRLDAQYNNNAVIESNTINAFIPVVVRKATVDSNITFNGTNTMTATNTDGIWCAIGTSEYEENGNLPTDATGKIKVTLNDTGLNKNGIYGIGLKGSGTEADPYQIGSIEDLILFRDSVNAGETKYNALGVYVALTADIDMADATWERGIGDGINATFDGIFDGKNFTIKNLNFAPVADSDKYFCGGLFGYTYGAAVIKNLVLENITVTAVGEGHNVGALVGFANNNGGKLTVSNVTVKNVTIDAPGAYGVGAIVGYSYRNMGTIENCTVDGATITGYRFVGGIVGYSYNDAIITGCTVNNAAISGTIGVGGIAGIALPGNNISGNTVTNTTVSAPNNWGYVVGEIAANSFTLGENNAADPKVGGVWETGAAVEAKIGNTYYATFADALEVAWANAYANNGAKQTIYTAAGEKYVELGVWGGIDWTLTAEGTLTIAPTKGTPVADANSGKTYKVGAWREAVRYDSKGNALKEEGWPYDRTKVKTLIIEEGVISIGSFSGWMPNLTGTVVIPWTVTYIGQDCFNGAPIQELIFEEVPAGETGEGLCIAQGAFKNLKITEVSLPADRPVHLHAWAFGNCHELKKAILPASITSVWGSEHIDYSKNFNSQSNVTWSNSSLIFTGCEKLESVTFGSEKLRNDFFADGRNGIDSWKNGVYNGDYIEAYVGLTSYKTLQAAINAAQNGETVKLIKNVTLTETLTVPAGKTIVLDLNGKTISQSKACTASYEMISNKGNLTITGNGKISFTDTGAGDPNFGWGSYTIRNEGTLVVENGTIEHKGAQAFATHMICAIFQYSGSTTINGGTISTPNYRSVRLWKGEMTINGGTFDGQIWVQAVDNSAKLTIEGGTFEPNGNDASSVFVSNATYNVAFAVTGGTFNGKIGANDATKLAGAITGGKFSESAKTNTNAALIVENHAFGATADADGYYTIVACMVKNETTGKTYETLAGAIADATAGDTITFLADITENVTINTAVTIDGAGKTFTGNMNLKANTTIKNVNFDGKGYNGYAVETRGANYLTIEDCTAKNYGYGFVQLASGTALTTVKNVTVSNMNYGVKVDYSNAVVLENVDMTAGVAAVLNSNYGAKTITIKNSKLNILGTWKRNDTTKTNYVFEGENTVGEFKTEAAIDSFKLAIGATVTAPNTITATTDAGYSVKYVDGKYIVKANMVAIGEETYASLAEALAAAQAGDTLTFLADITENVTINKAVTIDGANHKYTGTMTLNAGLTVTIQNVNFVNGGIAKTTKTSTGTYTIKGCTFDGAGEYYYPLLFKGAKTVTVENCTVTNYKYSFLYVSSSATNVSVKDVTVENCPNYAVYFASGVTNATFENLTVKNSNNGFLINNTANRTFTIKNCTMENVGTAINYSNGTYTITVKVLGNENDFATATIGQYVKCVLTETTATLTAPEGFTVTTTVENSLVKYVNGAYTVIAAAAKIGEKCFETFAEAYAAAEAGNTITLLAPIVVAKGETLELNKAVTITYTSNIAGEDMITNRGTLVIDGATLVYTNTDTTASNVTVSTISCEPGSVLEVKNGVVKNDSANNGAAGIYAYAIDLVTNGNLGDVTATISGGQVISTNYMAIRQFNNGTACKNSLTVTGGEIYGAKRAIQIHMDNNAAYLTISGGKIEAGQGGYALCLFSTNSTNIAVTGGDFVGTVYSATNGIISGGTFSEELYSDYIANGYGLFAVDGKYVVKGAVAQVGNETYATLQEAIKVAKTGETVVLLKDITVGDKDTTMIGSYKVAFNVDGKNITLNLNGKTIDVQYTGGPYLITVIRVADGAGLTVTGDGKIDVATNGINVAYMFWKAGTTGYLTIENGTYHMNDAGDSMVYTNGSEIVTVNGGTFILDAIGTRENGFPCIFNAQKNNEKNIVVNGGTFNADINHQYWCFEVEVAKNLALQKNANGTWTVVEAVAYVGEKVGKYTREVGYATLQEALAAAKDGETVVLLKDLELGKDDAVKTTDNLLVMLKVEGKSITLNLNGSTIAVNYDADTLLYSVIYVADGASLTVTGEGKINLTTGDTKAGEYDCVAYMFWKRGTTGALVVENGTFIANKVEDSMVYTNGDKVTINGGTWTLDSVDTKDNGSPWIFNVKGQNESSIVVTGGTFNYDINHQYYAFEVSIDKTLAVKNNGDGTWTVVPAVASVEEKVGKYTREVGYATLEEAIAAADEGEVVTLLNDVTLTETLVIPADKTIVLDLGGKTITGAPTEAKAYAVITNKGNLTIQGNGAIVCDHTLAGSTSYAVNTITNSGTLTINGGVIENKSTASNQIGYAIDNNSTTGNAVLVINGGEVKVSGSNYYDGIRLFCNSETNENSVTVNDGKVSSIWLQNPSDGTDRNTKNVKGSVTVSGGEIGYLYLEPSASFTAYITGGIVTGGVSYFETSDGRNLVGFITGGKFSATAKANTPAVLLGEKLTFSATTDADGYYSIVGAVAKIGDVYYATLAQAIAAAQAGDTITFLAHITEDVTVKKNLTIDGDGKTYTGNISVTGKTVDVVIKNVNFVNGTGYAVTTNNIKSITVENCTVDNYNFGFLYANKSTPTVVVKNVTVSNSAYGLHYVYGSNATLENVKMTNVRDGLYIQNYASKTITVKNSTITSIEIWERDGYSGVQTFKFEGNNIVGTLEASEYAKYVLAEKDAKLTAPADANVTSGVDGYKKVYADGAHKLEFVTFTVEMINIRMGETLSLIFAVPVQDGVSANHYVVFGAGDPIYSADWQELTVNGTKYYVFEYAGLAAKQMVEDVTIKFFFKTNEENLAAGIKTTSIRDYAKGILENSTDATFKKVAVDMLNYGAAAQTYFALQENITIDPKDLANATLTEAEKALGTETYADCANPAHNHSREGGETINRFFMATSVRFDDSISLVFKFDLRAYDIEDMKAEFIYTDHNGEEQTVDGTFVEYEEGTGIYTVELNALVIADAHQAVTCKITHTGEGASTYIVDSIAGYVARRVASVGKTDGATEDAAELYKAFMMFADSAYAYKHPQQ